MSGGQAVILVTGASRGIGAATARLAADRGYSVCVNYVRNELAADIVVAEITREGGRAIAVQADVAIEADVVRLFETVDRDLGPLRALVNNAGILERQTRVDRIDAARLTRVFATNVTGAFVCAREAVRRMGRSILSPSIRCRRSGSIAITIRRARPTIVPAAAASASKRPRTACACSSSR